MTDSGIFQRASHKPRSREGSLGPYGRSDRVLTKIWPPERALHAQCIENAAHSATSNAADCTTLTGPRLRVPSTCAIAASLNTRNGQGVWTEYEHKNSTLLLGLLPQLRRTCRSARRITLIAENYFIHNRAVVQRWLGQSRNFPILFQPFDHPRVNNIERLWKQVHDTVTRNHRCTTMAQLMVNVRPFLDVCRYLSRSALGIATLMSTDRCLLV